MNHSNNAMDEVQGTWTGAPPVGDQAESSWNATPRLLLNPSAKAVILLRNPKAGSGAGAVRFDALVSQLAQRGLEPLVVTDCAALASMVPTLLAEGSLRTVVAAGGDGTVELVANLTPAETPITVYPLGTENLLAKYLQISTAPDRTVDAILGGNCVTLDAGRFRRADGEERLFLLMLGCGFDAEVIHRLHQERRGNITHLSYAKPILDAIRQYRYPAVRVMCYETPTSEPFRTITAHWAFVFNAPSYASGLAICPEANPFDGHLDVITFRGGSFWQGLLHLGTVVLRRRERSRSVETARARLIRIESAEPVRYQVDGDPGGELPVELNVVPSRVRLVVPPSWSFGQVTLR